MIRKFAALLPRPLWWPNTGPHLLVGLVCLLSLVVSLSLSLSRSSTALAQDEPAFVSEVRVFEADNTGELYPAGLAFSPGANTLLVWQAGTPDQPSAHVSEVVGITPLEDRADVVSIATVVADPINMAFDSKNNRLLLFDTANHELLEIKAGEDGTLAPETLARFDARQWDLQSPQGMGVDALNGHLFILDGSGPRLLRVEPEADGTFDQATISVVDLQSTGLTSPRGLALHPATGHLHILDSGQKRLVELSQSGELVASRELSDLEIEVGHLRGMVFAPSGDQTDDPEKINLYLVDVADGGAGQPDGSLEGEQFTPRENQIYLPHVTGGTGAGAGRSVGRIVELTFVKPVVVAAAVDFNATLIRTVDMMNWKFINGSPSPRSTDPSGIAYVASRNRLVMVDGEIEEVPEFDGANLWDFTLTGAVDYTASVRAKKQFDIQLTDEPTGVAWNPDNGHYYISTDAKDRIFDVNPGADGKIGPGDTFSFFTTIAENGDPEGVAYGGGHIWVADGVNNEVYKYTLSGNKVGQFDVEQYGIQDPESVEYNHASGTLFVMASKKRGNKWIVETTESGALLRTIDISDANAVKAAGLAYAPASSGNGMSFYIVARGLDSDSDKNYADGKMYEVTAPGSSSPPPPGNKPPVANNDSASITKGTAVTIDVVDNDSDPDGNLVRNSADNLTSPAHGALVNNGNGTFRYTPNASFTGTDSFTYEVCDSQSACDSATVTINVTDGTTPPPPPPSDVIFADGFESGNLSAWSPNQTDGGDLSASSAAALAGSFGMQAVIDDNAAIYVTDDTPNGESRYRARFHFDPNSISMAKGDNFFIFYGYSGKKPVLRVQFRFSKKGYEIRTALRNDSSTWTQSAWFAITDAPHSIELDWQAAGANNGSLQLWIDDVQKAAISGVDNDTRRIDSVSLGAAKNVDSGTRGTVFFDEFESHRETPIGPVTVQVSAAESMRLAEELAASEEPEQFSGPDLYMPFVER